MAKFEVMGPDGIPTRPEPLGSIKEAKAELKAFCKRFLVQGYYSSVDGRISLSELPNHCRIQKVK